VVELKIQDMAKRFSTGLWTLIEEAADHVPSQEHQDVITGTLPAGASEAMLLLLMLQLS
jgi:hypothetical protein